ncbi:M15 family metallopeptidase [Tepidibacter sp. Z1-5]|uniref:M15 family metallopeptidase n=1 Tax=Tepidibacter sp. Z1-5 TaxID=3134138 RepID=UPI0030C32C78
MNQGVRIRRLKKRQYKRRLLNIFIGIIVFLIFIMFNKINSLAYEKSYEQENDSKIVEGLMFGDEKENRIEDNQEDIIEDNQEVNYIQDSIVLANKTHTLSSDYIPKDLVVPNVSFSFKEDNPKKQMRREAAVDLENLFNGANDGGIKLYAVSGYRSYQRQKTIFDNKVRQVGKEKANKVVAYPGQSEHQTGLAMDVSSISVKCRLVESFGDTKEGIWLKENCYKYGFIIRYQKGKEDITGYSYEPWHIRYVGKEAANYINNKDITLEEYIMNN